jgi:beta-glucosidase
VADVLTGKVDPSGKLPLTLPRRVGQILAANPEQHPGVDGTAHYTEGIDVGYHIYAARDIKPLFPLGFGPSYTTFSFRGLKVTHAPDSHTTAASFTVTNTDKFAGAEVAQLYLGFPPITEGNEQPIQLKGFRRMMLNSGQSKTVTLTLDARSFSFWLVGSHEWKIAQGTIQGMVGDFSANKPLKSTLSVRLELDPTWPPPCGCRRRTSISAAAGSGSTATSPRRTCRTQACSRSCPGTRGWPW